MKDDGELFWHGEQDTSTDLLKEIQEKFDAGKTLIVSADFFLEI